MTVVSAVILACAVALVGAVVLVGYALARDRIRTRAANDRHAVDTQHEIAKLAANAQIESQKKAAGDLFEAARVVNQYGFLLLRPDEVATRAMQQGFVVLDPNHYQALLGAVKSRTNTSGEAERMIRKAGLNLPNTQKPAGPWNQDKGDD